MSRPWEAAGFPPLAERPFDLDVDEESFALLAELLPRFGDIVGVAPDTRDAATVVLNHPDYVRHVFGRNYGNYTKGLGKERVRLLLGKGLIVSEGEDWLHSRRMIQPAFHRDVIARLAETIAAVNLQFLERWRRRAAAGEPIDVTTDLARLTLEIIVRCLFGDDIEELIEAEGDIPFAFLAQELSRDFRTVQRFLRPRRQIRSLLERRRRRGEEHRDLIGMLMAARHPETGEPMSDKALTDEVTTLVVAGHETSASTLNWAWYLLSRHPEVEAELHSEVDALDLPGAPGFADLASLDRTRRVLEETLRLYPPGWVLTRRAIETDTVGPYTLPAGTDVLVSPYFLHRHPRYWPDPQRFDPDRFAAGEERHRFAYIPFGAGPRRCIGDFFAMVEMQIHLALVARHLKLSYLGDGPPALEARINLRTREPLLFRAELRG
jgi:cytochrome P450